MATSGTPTAATGKKQTVLMKTLVVLVDPEVSPAAKAEAVEAAADQMQGFTVVNTGDKFRKLMGEKTKFVLFYFTCGKYLDGIIDQDVQKCANDFGDSLLVGKIDLDVHEMVDFGHHFDVETVPAFLLFRRSERVKFQSPMVGKEGLKKMVDELKVRLK